MAKATITADDGAQTDITEGIAAIYDALVGSLDWGSGFLSVEDIEHILTIGRAMGFALPADWEKQLKYAQDDAAHRAEIAARQR